MCQAVNIVDSAGFQTTVLPMSAGAVGRLAMIAVKLKGVTAKTKPSKGRAWLWFHRPRWLLGWAARMFSPKKQL